MLELYLNSRLNCSPQVSGSNVVSVAEHVIMSILLLVRNFVPAHEVCSIPPPPKKKKPFLMGLSDFFR